MGRKNAHISYESTLDTTGGDYAQNTLAVIVSVSCGICSTKEENFVLEGNFNRKIQIKILITSLPIFKSSSTLLYAMNAVKFPSSYIVTQVLFDE